MADAAAGVNKNPGGVIGPSISNHLMNRSRKMTAREEEESERSELWFLFHIDGFAVILWRKHGSCLPLVRNGVIETFMAPWIWGDFSSIPLSFSHSNWHLLRPITGDYFGEDCASLPLAGIAALLFVWVWGWWWQSHMGTDGDVRRWRLMFWRSTVLHWCTGSKRWSKNYFVLR